jgi:purine-binding chemotaxis protein CheW
MSGTVASFWVDGVLFGIDVVRVREVVHEMDILPVPGSPPGVLGLASRRGQIVAAIDARQRLGLPARNSESSTAHFVIATGSRVESLVVDREDDVLELDPACRDDVPETIDPAIRAHVIFVCQRDNGLLLVLDIDGVLATPESKGASPHAGTGR